MDLRRQALRVEHSKKPVHLSGTIEELHILTILT
jgi:hypothetical protein